jgi:DNA-binding transcriptional ArsR family regulator
MRGSEATAELSRSRIRRGCGSNAVATSASLWHAVRAASFSQPTVSHHLKKLTEAGLLERGSAASGPTSRWRDAVDTLAAVADLKGVCC